MFENYILYYSLGILSIVIVLASEIYLKTTYNKYAGVMSSKGITGAQFARQILDASGLKDIEIVKIAGEMTDYYNPRKKVVALSESTYDSSSIVALGIAGHEVGHALQYKNNYFPIKIRNVLIPIATISSRFLLPIIIIGIILGAYAFSSTDSYYLFVKIAIIIYSTLIFLNLITLPVEYDASRRSKKMLKELQILDGAELEGASQVLNAAALTYVAGLITSIIELLRFIAIFGNGRKRD
jgi:Zn-dependent membrane protease YugP